MYLASVTESMELPVTEWEGGRRRHSGGAGWDLHCGQFKFEVPTRLLRGDVEEAVGKMD